MTEIDSNIYDTNGYKKLLKAIEWEKIGQDILFAVAANHESRLKTLEKTVKKLLHENKILKEQLKEKQQIPDKYEFK